jgi:two-component system sensor histidine kinase BarA
MAEPHTHPPALDWALAVERAGGNAALAADLMDMLRAELPQRVAAMEAAASRGDDAALEEEVHRVVGSCRYCGVPALEAAASHLDGLLHRGEPWQRPDLDAITRAAAELESAEPPA